MIGLPYNTLKALILFLENQPMEKATNVPKREVKAARKGIEAQRGVFAGEGRGEERLGEE